MVEYLKQICKEVYDELGLKSGRTYGECAKASYALFNRLQELSIKAEFCVVNQCHCLLITMVDDMEYVLDLTYSQFDHYQVGPIVEPLELFKDRRSNYDIWITFPTDNRKDVIERTSDVNHFLNCILFKWPLDQKPICV